ncbi:conserved hypothetical protein [Vibrio chagasii]|nr:conserved hypothetical protein [Vibrio chagasii]
MISIIIPYIGKVDKNHIIALNQLANTEFSKINFITVYDELEHKEMISSKVQVFDISDVFKTNNKLGVELEGLIANPYKFCDLKPFYNIIFDIQVGDYWGFSDLDCIFNSIALSEKFSNIVHEGNNEKVYGNRGHLMVFGKQSSKWVQNELIKVIDDFLNENINLLDIKTNYALDEFKFLHKILSNQSNTIWDKEHFYPIMDVDYKNLVPKNLNLKEEIRFDSESIYLNKEYCNYSYIHLQKRKIINDFSKVNDTLYLNLDEKNGHFIYSNSHREDCNSRFVDDVNYYLKMFRKRLESRLKNHGFGFRPSL